MAGFARTIEAVACFAFTAGAQPAAHFHHLHLNTTDPTAAVEFYTRRFECEKARLNGVEDAVWAQKSWILFIKVDAAPPWELVSAIWHFGWGAENMKAEYERQLSLGTKFFTPITDISDLANVPGFFYAYVESPDHALIELNTAGHHHFGHLHLFSDDPVSAGEWYTKHFGAVRRGTRPPSREPRFYKGYQVGPGASLMMDNVNIIIFPAGHARQAYPEHWKGRATFATTRGRVVDHVAFSVDDLADALGRLRSDGITVIEEPRARSNGLKSAFVQGPDNVAVEVVEGHARKEPDPAAWGSNHAGQPIPQFVAGDECLFCHRNDIGPTWPKNAHQRTVREGTGPEEYILGAGTHTRLLKKAGYGKFDIQTPSGWNNDRFAGRCAGCHTTGVDVSTKTFSAIGLECYTCHGDVTLNHTKDTSLIWLSKKRRGDARAVTSICAQCHLRVAAKARSTGLPYPNNFIAGDNLFQDYAVDLAQADNAALNPADRHVYRNVRDIALKGSDTTCLSCHQVHASSTAKHRRVLWSSICEDCHYPEGPKKNVKRSTVSSARCEY